MLKKPRTFFTCLYLAVSAALFAGIDGGVPGLAVLFSWLLAASAAAFFLCGYDKAIAGGGRTRVPEGVLLFAALIGGAPGLVAAMGLFRHKTLKGSFRIKLLSVLVLQAALILCYLFWLKPRL